MPDVDYRPVVTPNGATLPFKIVGRELKEGPWHGGGAWMTAAPGYFEVFKIKVLQGRTR